MSYQPHSADAFYHQYSYDAENRITGVRTSTDSIEWQNDASYTYYRHGPLARVQIGDLQLQGIDYAYTVQGWLKSINPSWITPTGSTDQFDSDGVSNPALFERDAYKLNLNYFDDGTYRDFIPVNLLTGYVQGNSLLSTAKHNLYNGNIGSMAINIRQLWASPGKRDAGPMLYNYQYDQLNRISSMDAWAANGSFQPINTSPLQDYAERYTYDPNGNILTLNRNGDSTGVSMDQLSYKYIYATTGGGNGEYVPGQAPTSGVSHLTNQLSSIQDAVTGNSYTGDIKSQSAYNYTYNAIGELTGDAQQAITNVSWNVYGKILSLSDSGNTISFTYDAAGNRISKTAHGITTWYVRDAQGNVMSVYTQGNSAINSGALSQTEAHLYGSSRLGLLDLSVNCGTSLTQPTSLSLVRGNKLFELTNHLGNVLETISDKKVQHTSDNSTVDYYLADVLNANDYYSFGMEMPERSYNATTAANYRYGFNGKENDNEVKGTGNQIDYGMRMYDSRVGRFLSVDPIAKKYPQLTPYQFASNRPIEGVDRDGKEYDPTNPVAGFFAYWIFIKPVEMSVQGASNVYQGTVEKTMAETGQASYNNDHVPDNVQRKLAQNDELEGTAKQVLGVGQMVQSYADISTTYTPLFMEGISSEGFQRGASGILDLFEDKAATPIEIPFTAEESASRQLAEKSRVFTAGGSIDILEGAGELNVNVENGKLSGKFFVGDQTIFLEGKINTQNNVLAITDIGIQTQAGYNSLGSQNRFGPVLFSKLIKEIETLGKAAGFKEGYLERERLRPEGSPLADRPNEKIQLNLSDEKQ